MEKNKISNFLTPDIAYLLGLITGRGEIQYSNELKKIIIDFEYKNLISRAITKTFDQKLHIQTSLDPVVSRLQRIGLNAQKLVHESKISIVVKWQQEDIAWQFIKFLINHSRFSYHDFLIPESIFESLDASKREFLRGLCDVTAYVRNSNRDQAGRHRVYIEISNRNWFLPAQICKLMQSLGVPTQYIGYGHPNLRGGTGTSWAKEHQMKIYAEDFELIGFYISHKDEALKELAEYNRSNFNRNQDLCDGTIGRYLIKQSHSHESHDKLPSQISGKHFNHFKEICSCLGCYMQARCDDV